MNRRNLYGVFYQRDGRPVWALRTRADRAKREAQRNDGYVMVVQGGMGRSWAGCAGDITTGWDAPTFRMTADLVADYRPAPAEVAL